MRKLTIGLLVSLLVFGLLVPSYSHASNVSKRFNKDQSINEEKVSLVSLIEEDMINVVKPYVEVSDDGMLQFKDVPQEIYDKYALDELQKHFDNLNGFAENEHITINEDLSIDDNMISPFAVYGKWTYHWWGYDRKFDNAQTKDYIDYCHSVVGGATLVTGAGAFFPPISVIGGMQAGYWTLFAARLSANNKGRGVYVSVTWVAVFDIEPL